MPWNLVAVAMCLPSVSVEKTAPAGTHQVAFHSLESTAANVHAPNVADAIASWRQGLCLGRCRQFGIRKAGGASGAVWIGGLRCVPGGEHSCPSPVLSTGWNHSGRECELNGSPHPHRRNASSVRSRSTPEGRRKATVGCMCCPPSSIC